VKRKCVGRGGGGERRNVGAGWRGGRKKNTKECEKRSRCLVLCGKNGFVSLGAIALGKRLGKAEAASQKDHAQRPRNSPENEASAYQRVFRWGATEAKKSVTIGRKKILRMPKKKNRGGLHETTVLPEARMKKKGTQARPSLVVHAKGRRGGWAGRCTGLRAKKQMPHPRSEATNANKSKPTGRRDPNWAHPRNRGWVRRRKAGPKEMQVKAGIGTWVHGYAELTNT